MLFNTTLAVKLNTILVPLNVRFILYSFCHQPQDPRRHKRIRNDGGRKMAQMQPSLPTNQAFVVQFRTQSAAPQLSWEGRVEHVSSGQVLRFHSPEELLTFLACKLKEVLEAS
jgi:hypothetical protein